MKKRSKILMSLIMFVLCCGMLVFGVWSAGSASFNVTSNLSFNPNGFYIHATGQVKRGATADTVTAIESYNYEQMNYTPVSAQDDTPNGGKATTLTDWEIGTVEFKDDEPVVIYELTIKNKSPFAIEMTVDDGEAFTTIYYNLNYYSCTSENKDAVIQPDATATYKFIATLTNFTEKFTAESFQISVNFEKYIEPKPFIYSATGGVLTSILLNGNEVLNEVLLPYSSGDYLIDNYPVTNENSVCVKQGDSLVFVKNDNGNYPIDLSVRLCAQGTNPHIDSQTIPANIKNAFNAACTITRREDDTICRVEITSLPEIPNGYFIYVGDIEEI